MFLIYTPDRYAIFEILCRILEAHYFERILAGESVSSKFRGGSLPSLKLPQKTLKIGFPKGKGSFPFCTRFFQGRKLTRCFRLFWRVNGSPFFWGGEGGMSNLMQSCMGLFRPYGSWLTLSDDEQGVYNHLLRKVFRFHYHSQKVSQDP